jgi:GH35 family endo-1,4-beta-xylanase
MTSRAFSFGTNIPGNSVADVNSYIGANPVAGSKADLFQQFINSHFNSVVPSNYGKWGNTEATRDSPLNPNTETMTQVNTVLQYARAHNMTARMHNLIWGDTTSQPSWVATMLNNPNALDAVSGSNPGGSGNVNSAALRDEISERIAYYVGDGDPDGNGIDGNSGTPDVVDKPDEAPKYAQLDVLNEALHQPKYWNIYGASGVASIYHNVAQGVAASGAQTKLYTNEFNVLQNSPASVNTSGTGIGSDPYANWYRQNIDDIQNAGVAQGFGEVVSGVGSQYYPITETVAGSPAPPSTNNVMKAIQNLAVTGLPLSLTEFGAQSTVTDPDLAAKIVNQSLRMVFGNPTADSFMYWGFWEGATSNLQSGSILVHTDWKNPDGTWDLTPAGRAYEDLLDIQDWDGDTSDGWSTDTTLPVGPHGTIDFTGFYGDYDVTINGHIYHLSLSKGTNQYSIVVAEGDYNGDGRVDSADYTVWRDTLGSTTDLRADGNGDGKIDAPDYDKWAADFGVVYSGGSGAAAVPEPTGLALLLVGGFALSIGQRRRLRPAQI